MRLVLAAFFGISVVCAPARAEGLVDAQIVALLIAQSAAGYTGRCRCPNDVDARGRRCGGRSAHSRGGGVAPICSAEDVTPELLSKYKAVAASAAR